MKRLFLTLLVICFSFSIKLFAQPGMQPLSAASPVISADNITTGFVIRQPAPDRAFHPEYDFLKNGLREEYLQKSKRQKRTALILLGTGVALIGTGIAVAYAQDDDAIAAGVSLVLISGPGLITSLISIPFFVASARNKRKAASISSSFELMRSPVDVQNGAGYRTYPGLKLAMDF